MSKYKGLIDDIKEKQSGAVPFEDSDPPSPAPLPSPAKTPKPLPEKRRAGRPKGGKSSDPEFVQTTAYVEETVLIAVKKALLDVKGMDFSDLVNDLLRKWAKSRI